MLAKLNPTLAASSTVIEITRVDPVKVWSIWESVVDDVSSARGPYQRRCKSGKFEEFVREGVRPFV